MARILKLSNHLANQIAAGEVVERPASVLKELLENSLDAGGNQIDIKIKRGGIGLIQVQDNGIGICKDDLELALSQHATSKIFTLEDLEQVNSFGFRGEALASISSVSRFELTSKIKEAEYGWTIRKEGRDFTPELIPAPHPIGTCIEVRDLFFNTPARLKFLKSEKTELGYLEELFKRIALSHFEVAFSFQEGLRNPKRFPVCKELESRARRIALLCGNQFIDNAITIEAESNGLKLTGWLGTSESLRAQADLQYFYVNGRIIKDKVVNHAIKQAYEAYCLPGKFPAYLLYLELDPKALDINVHPTKHEVRFREARIVHAFLSYSITDALSQIEKRPSSNHSKNHLARSFESMSCEAPPFYEKYNNALNSTIHNNFMHYTILGGGLLFLEADPKIKIIDLNSIKKAIMLTVLQERYQNKTIKSIVLSRPKVIDVASLSPSKAQIKSDIFNWEQLGFEVNECWPNQMLLRRIPDFLSEEWDGLEDLMVDILKLSPLAKLETLFETMIEYTISHTLLTENEIKEILSDIGKYPQFCRELTIEQFKKLFF